MKTIELRSDTMTTLTPEMRESILTSPYGDWNYNQDPTVIKLQKYAAQLFGCQDAAYVPSATFGNQCAILTTSHPGEEMIIRDQSHIIRHQNGSPGRIARVMTKTISLPFGYLTPQELKKYLRKKKDHQAPKCGILCLQYPSFEGVIPTLESIQQCSKLAIAEGINVHIDGARIFTALAQSKIDPKEIMKYTTTLTICLSKGLLAPVGSIVVGKTKELMTKFKANRKMMGGVFRKPGVVAGPALISLQKMRHQLWKDNQMARLFAKRLEELDWVKVVRKVETNMVYYEFTDPRVDGTKIMHYLFQNKILSWIGNATNRFVLHHYIREKEIDIVIQLFQKWRNENVLNEISQTAEEKLEEKKDPEEKNQVKGEEALKTQDPLADATQH